MFSTLPLLTDVKRSLEACKAEQVSSKTCLEEKLFQFSNQLVKMKSDTKMDLNEFRKTLELSSAMLADH